MGSLTRYTKPTDTQNENYLTQKQYVKSLRDGNHLSVPDDFRTPFTYQQWIKRNSNISPGGEYEQYTKYVRDWHKNTYTSEDTINLIKQDYYALLNQLKLTIVNPEELSYLSELDISDDLDLEEAIPLFTKRLKELAIYFINKRDSIKKAKLKYNMVGSSSALERIFYEYILKAFSKRDYVLNVPEQSAYDTFPELSAIRDGFQIYIEELYDDTSYFDKDPNVSVTTYYDLSNSNIQKYFTERGFGSEDIEWIFGTGISDIHAENPLVWTLSGMLDTYGVSGLDLLPASAFASFDNVLLNEYVRMQQSKKYLGETQYVLSGGYYDIRIDDFRYDFQQGNNWFYWTSGEYFLEPSETYYDPIPLTSTNLITNGASAASTYEMADKIFVEQGGVINGAWLYMDEIRNMDKTMKAHITPFNESNNGKGFQFKFPFSDYGLSAEDISYTYPGFDNFGSLYNVLSQELKRSVQHAYWNLNYSTSSIEPISIHDTELVDNGAHPAFYYNDADKVFVRRTSNDDKIHDTQPNSVYQETFERSWLYKFDRTDLPVQVGQNYINWPIHTYARDENAVLYPTPSSQCTPILLSSINVEETMIGARAGYGLFDSDIIYKLDSWNGYPRECAWLSGHDLQNLASGTSTLMYNATGKIQPSFTLRCRPGREERFVWQDGSKYIDETNIIHHSHQLDCPYRLQSHKSIAAAKDVPITELGTNGIGDWMNCKCRSIKYSPLGHPGDKFSDYNSMADFIIVDTQFPNKFDINTWLGTDGLPYNLSKDFAWFHVHSGNSIEPDIGWGPGEWRTGDGSRFELTPGVLYQYIRANLLRNPGELILDVVPELIIKEKHTQTPPAKWMRAELNNEGTWDKIDEPSDMILYPGDYLVYDHMDSNWFCLTSEGDYGEYIDYQRVDSVATTRWATNDIVTVPKKVSYLWTESFYVGGPEHVATELSAVTWMVDYPTGENYSVEKIDPAELFSFNIESTGIYTVSAIGYGQFGSEMVTVSPDLTGSPWLEVPTVSGSYNIETIYNDRLNMTVNIPLMGWNYTTNTFDITSNGARPFWAIGHDDSSSYTKSKGARDWGGGIQFPMDDYTMVLQPDISEITLELGDFVEYRYMGDFELRWVQPFILNTDIQNKQWSKLIIDPQVTSPLSSFLYNLDKELVISATKLPSDIILEQKCGETTFINYYSQGEFTWSQSLTDSSAAGQIWISPETEILIDPLAPYTNLTNRHFPTVASVPYIGNLFGESDVGGFFLPKNLGSSVYQNRQLTTDFTTEGSDTVVYRNANIYSKDYGLTQEYQKSPVVITDINSNWMKSGVTTSFRAGFVSDVKNNQTFIPYQSKYESIKTGNVGIRHITDDYTPWNGEKDNEWIDETNFPPDFRGQYPITQWYNQFPLLGDKTMSVWKMDIFGNNYALFKERDLSTIYAESTATGEFWVRNSLGVVGTANELLTDVFNKIVSPSSLFQDVTSNNIINFDIIYDVLIIETPNYVVMTKLKFDYNTGRIYSIADDVRYIDLSESWFSGYWFNEVDNRITFAELRVVSDIITPILHTYNINSGERVIRSYTSEDISSYGLSDFRKPLYTYNNRTKTHNITLIATGASGMNILIFNINNDNVISYLIQPVNSYVGGDLPNTEPRDLIKTNLLEDNSIIATFEGRFTGNIYTCIIKDLEIEDS